MPSENLREVATAELLRRHRAIQQNLDDEEDMPEERRPFAGRENSDVRRKAEEIEQELDRRGEKYRRITW